MAQELEENIAENQKRFEKVGRELKACQQSAEQAQKRQQEALNELRAQEIRSAEIKQRLASAKEALSLIHI